MDLYDPLVQSQYLMRSPTGWLKSASVSNARDVFSKASPLLERPKKSGAGDGI
jgi:hypothetical protein